MKQPYNHQYRPPIPVLSVRLYSPISDRFTPTISALVDTGSDASLIPLTHIDELGAEETAPGWLVGITGDRKPVSLFFVDIYIGEQVLAGIRVIGDPDADEVILGRDVLNKLPVFLDGPQKALVIPDDKTINRLRRE
ncbi:pepsin/retropepsin-like aspartic protease family protein [Candidatus Promineifilum breve]|uniref:hypothetical protein n=1 Tax=Candidatus Promineifilum breve TaxID=1806508 RepID=UPI0007C1B9B5|nr:hypothetical protein [Candidatus Promineifilum breve]